MGRPPRLDIKDGWHHVMNRGVARQRIFFSDADRVEFERLLGVGHDRLGVEVHAYCLMTNHFHLLVRCPDGGLPDFMHQLGSVYVRHVNERIGRDGPLFRGRYHAISVESDDYVLTATRYIHRNVLDIAPGEPLDRYRWSSHRIYTGMRRQPPWFRTDSVLRHFDDDPERFDEFVDGDRPVGAASGSWSAIPDIVDLVVDEHDLEGPRQGVARTTAVLMLDGLDEPRARALSARLGLATEQARRKALRRAHDRLAQRPELADIVLRLRQLAA